MESGVRPPAGQASIKLYNAVYSSVQVYECMVRGIAVMRRRSDSYVNATQILKVAGIDKGRRTKILEKEILPGKHEIVQGGYGKYQGTWIPLERGRDLANQFGVAPLLAPLFDFQPNPSMLGPLPVSLTAGLGVPSRPLSASSLPGLQASGSSLSGGLAPPPIMPGSALRLLNQGRAQGLFTPSTTTLALLAAGAPGSVPLNPQSLLSGHIMDAPSPALPTPAGMLAGTPVPNMEGAKRRHSQREDGSDGQPTPFGFASPPLDAHMADLPHMTAFEEGEDGPLMKRMRTDLEPEPTPPPLFPLDPELGGPSSVDVLMSAPNGNGLVNDTPAPNLNGHVPVDAPTTFAVRPASKPFSGRGHDTSGALKDARRAAIVAHIFAADEPAPVLDALRADQAENPASPSGIDADGVLDEMGHTALHLAASMARMQTVQALLASGADVHRGNYSGETALVRACLALHNFDHQVFHRLVELLHGSLRTVDTSGKSILHHVVALAGVKGRTVPARYYLDGVLYWIAQHQDGDFKSIADLQDEHGDTALNIAARVGNRGLIKCLLDVGANRTLPNKLGLRPGDFGLEVDDLGGSSGPPRNEDLFSNLRSAQPVPAQKSQDAITQMGTLIQSLSAEFNAEIKTRQDALDVTQAHLRAATRELAEQRKQIQLWQARCSEADQLEHQLRNLDKAVAEEDAFEWTGRADLDARDARLTAPHAFRWSEYAGSVPSEPTYPPPLDPSVGDEADIPLPQGNGVETLVRLRRLKIWSARMESLLEERARRLQGADLLKEFQCRKIVALCTGQPVDKVEQLLDDLVKSVENEQTIVDLSRVQGFMQKVRDGII